MRDRVMPAAVQISIVASYAEDEEMRVVLIPVGSGTIISSRGTILTNAHVVDFARHRAALDSWAASGTQSKSPRDYTLFDGDVVISLPTPSGQPNASYLATIVMQDDNRDLAVLQIDMDIEGRAIGRDQLDLPFVPLGDSDEVRIGDPIDIFGYPAVGGNGLTYTTGVVSGF
ncbi:MAG: trypsin-like peptidase domain-containing protein, partial [Thermomicrobiales bacterium]|nr:trypsin-like peptidase domain-containing protein [Thermomicrobiales bacterium]